jgi:hypothetical protein
MNASFPSLAGIERALAEDWHWACGVFTWAMSELRITERAAAAQPLNRRLRKAASDTSDAITQQLEKWEPPHRAN